MKKLLGLVFSQLISINLYADPGVLSHQQTEKEYQDAIRNNRLFQSDPGRINSEVKPVTDTADFKYVLMNAEEGFSEVANLRKTIAQNLPDDVKLVILTTKSNAPSVLAKYKAWVADDQLIIAAHDNPYVANGFWARDSFPIPVSDKETQETSLVSLKYFRTFQSAQTLADNVGAKLATYNLTFVGGNFMSDEDGNCFSVNSSRLFNMTESDIKGIFGCTTVHLLPYVAGIGDVDEVVKILPGKRVLIAPTSYKVIFEDLGYTVTVLPQPGGGKYRTYANSLAVGETLFMPVYGTANDAIATKIYEDFGYKVFPIKSNTLSDTYLGSIHCQTMAYPAISLDKILAAFDAEVIDKATLSQ